MCCLSQLVSVCACSGRSVVCSPPPSVHFFKLIFKRTWFCSLHIKTTANPLIQCRPLEILTFHQLDRFHKSLFSISWFIMVAKMLAFERGFLSVSHEVPACEVRWYLESALRYNSDKMSRLEVWPWETYHFTIRWLISTTFNTGTLSLLGIQTPFQPLFQAVRRRANHRPTSLAGGCRL